MNIVFSMPSRRRRRWWVDHLQSLMPEARVIDAGDNHDPAHVDYAVVWRPETGWLAGYPRLKAVVSIGAGIDHVLADPALPDHLPILRTTGDDLTQRMREYVALHVLRLHRGLPDTERAMSETRWAPSISPVAGQRTVGVMGLGTLGGAAATTLQQLGFRVCGWSRRARTLTGVHCHHGEAGLDAFLATCEILVCLLPLTPATRHILDATLFSRLPRGASIINVGRGGHLVESDLIEALDGEQLAHATLDVFEQEPLPPDHPFWHHPRVLVTPHVASLIDPESGGRLIAASIRDFEASGSSPNLTDSRRGY